MTSSMPSHSEVVFTIFALTPLVQMLRWSVYNFKRRDKRGAKEWTENHLLDQFNEFTTVEKEVMLDANVKNWNRHLAWPMAWLWDNGLRDWVYGRDKDEGVAPANEHARKENHAWVAMGDTGDLRPERRPRRKRRQIN